MRRISCNYSAEVQHHGRSRQNGYADQHPLRPERLWEYATGPMGDETYLMRIGGDGRVKAATQLLTSEQFDKIIGGRTTKPEVRHLLGEPSDVNFFNGEPVWEWRIRVDPNPARFIVRFNRDGIVRDTMVLLDITSDDGRGEKGGHGGKK